MCNIVIWRDTARQSQAAVIILTEGVFLSGIITLVGRKLKIDLFKIYNYFSINIYMADFSVLFYLYRNRNIRGIILNK